MVEARKPTSSDSTKIKFQNIFEPINPSDRRTKMICNIKFSSSRDDMMKMLDAGMNIASFNFTLGD